jgi:hypothetical protein
MSRPHVETTKRKKCGDAFYVYHYPMKSEKGVAEGLQKFIMDVGSPRQIHTDNAEVETQVAWRKIANDAWARDSTTEPYTPKQNKCKHKFGATRIHARVIMETTKCPEQLWDYVIKYVCYVRNRTARKALDYKTPHEVLLGNTPDISELFDFEFYQPVQYMDNPEVKFPQLKTKLGQWLGIATSVGQALCYYILLTANGTVITRSTVKALEDPESPHVRREIEAYDRAVMDEIQPTELADAKYPDVQELRKKEALKVAQKIPMGTKTDKGEPDYETLNRHVFYEINEGNDHEFVDIGLNVNTFYNNELEEDEHKWKNLTGAEILTAKGGQTVRGKVKGKKRDQSGNPVTADDSDEPLYIGKYPDGTISAEGYNALLNAITVQTDENGNEYHSFKAIMDHQVRPRGGREDKKGWFFKKKKKKIYSITLSAVIRATLSPPRGTVVFTPSDQLLLAES